MKKVSSIFFLLCVSCSSLRDANNSNTIAHLSSKNIYSLNGSYYRRSIEKKGDLFWDFFVNGYDNVVSDLVSLKVIDDNHIKVSLITNGNTVREKILMGEIKDNYFVFKRKSIIYPLVFTNLYKDSKIRIGLLPNGNLIADSKNLRYGTILIFPFYEKEKNYNLEYKRIP